ncbi:MAG: DUF4386 domain-containing protein [Pseudomonadales bacterium]|nr:DUF4386 domain-containing protein [Pseudomonadales bacterium]MCP5172080.1 DUF4386 domain-containing protein [Pseudomonadales bacterium]
MKQISDHPPKQLLKNQPRVIGGLILSAFICYGGGSALISGGESLLGITLLLLNSVVVITIGVLFSGLMVNSAPVSAHVYLATRITEGVLLGSGGLMWVFGSHFVTDSEAWNTTLYQLGMIILGIGSISLCKWLLDNRAVPALLARLGLIGYPLLAIGMVMGLIGSEDWAAILLLPGAMFEVILGLWLIIKGLLIPSRTTVA